MTPFLGILNTVIADKVTLSFGLPPTKLAGVDRARHADLNSFQNCNILILDMCTLESFQESLFFLKTESGVTFSQKHELTPNAGGREGGSTATDETE